MGKQGDERSDNIPRARALAVPSSPDWRSLNVTCAAMGRSSKRSVRMMAEITKDMRSTK